MTVEKIATAIKNILPNQAIYISETLELLMDTLNSTRVEMPIGTVPTDNGTLAEQCCRLSRV
ncbi:hypothetical protein [Sporomusa sp. KB1]|jgi:hypothetical protein|uniref:hypothetical protein n=1 Tax=Sporomusa sp. KB1 TaxID=943346 RepID=UPI0011A366F5|nr:hypothetical protein [Sporomusa sp. KB1]TWH52010.1 hypothetical protein Salpa_0515 [Sporomusa sp. KB1]